MRGQINMMISGKQSRTCPLAARLERRHPRLHERRFDANVRWNFDSTPLNYAALQAGCLRSSRTAGKLLAVVYALSRDRFGLRKATLQSRPLSLPADDLL